MFDYKPEVNSGLFYLKCMVERLREEKIFRNIECEVYDFILNLRWNLNLHLLVLTLNEVKTDFFTVNLC